MGVSSFGSTVRCFLNPVQVFINSFRSVMAARLTKQSFLASDVSPDEFLWTCFLLRTLLFVDNTEVVRFHWTIFKFGFRFTSFSRWDVLISIKVQVYVLYLVLVSSFSYVSNCLKFCSHWKFIPNYSIQSRPSNGFVCFLVVIKWKFQVLWSCGRNLHSSCSAEVHFCWHIYRFFIIVISVRLTNIFIGINVIGSSLFPIIFVE